MLFWIHTISSITATVLIIWLALSCLIKRIKHHKALSIVLFAASIVSLTSSLLYGFAINLTIEWSNIHYITGFASLILSLVPMMALITRNDKWHHNYGYAAAVMVVISLITGFIAYAGPLSSYFIRSGDCINLSSLNDSGRCLVAVDGVVYDMTDMPRWSSGQHYTHGCGGNYSKEQILEAVPSHSADKYYGPIIGTLCAE